MYKQIWGLFLLLVTVVVEAEGGIADTSLTESPKGEVILVIEGKIGKFNSENSLKLDLEMVKSLPQLVIKTTNPWEPGPTEYQGPSLAALLEGAGAFGENLRVEALNGYFSYIPMDDVHTTWPILAWVRNGKAMSIADKGPLFVVFPFTDNESIRTENYFAKSVWQVERIAVE